MMSDVMHVVIYSQKVLNQDQIVDQNKLQEYFL